MWLLAILVFMIIFPLYMLSFFKIYVKKMENKELTKMFIWNCMCYYFDVIIKIQNVDFNNIVIDENLYEIILNYDVSCKSLISEKHLFIMFDKVDGLIRNFDKTKYFSLFGSEKHNVIFYMTRCIISLIIVETSKLIQMMICCQKKYDLHRGVIQIK